MNYSSWNEQYETEQCITIIIVLQITDYYYSVRWSKAFDQSLA